MAPGPGALLRDVQPVGALHLFWHVVEVLREWAWYGATNRVLYLGDDVVGRLVEGAQEKVREE